MVEEVRKARRRARRGQHIPGLGFDPKHCPLCRAFFDAWAETTADLIRDEAAKGNKQAQDVLDTLQWLANLSKDEQEIVIARWQALVTQR